MKFLLHREVRVLNEAAIKRLLVLMGYVHLLCGAYCLLMSVFSLSPFQFYVVVLTSLASTLGGFWLVQMRARCRPYLTFVGLIFIAHAVYLDIVPMSAFFLGLLGCTILCAVHFPATVRHLTVPPARQRP